MHAYIYARIYYISVFAVNPTYNHLTQIVHGVYTTAVHIFTAWCVRQ